MMRSYSVVFLYPFKVLKQRAKHARIETRFRFTYVTQFQESTHFSLGLRTQPACWRPFKSEHCKSIPAFRRRIIPNLFLISWYCSRSEAGCRFPHAASRHSDIL